MKLKSFSHFYFLCQQTHLNRNLLCLQLKEIFKLPYLSGIGISHRKFILRGGSCGFSFDFQVFSNTMSSSVAIIAIILLLLYDSAARVQELCDLKVCDVRVDTPAVVHLFGKGNKNREVPLTEPCAKVLRRYIQENHLDASRRGNDPLFVNPQGKKLTRSGISYILAKYICQANEATNVAMPVIIPHCLRHSKAMHLVEAEKSLIYIRDFLGHESIETTQIYAKSNPEARRKALETMNRKMKTPDMPDWNDNPDIKAFLKGL